MAKCAVFMMPAGCGSRVDSSGSLCGAVERRRQENGSGLANTESLQKGIEGQGLFLLCFFLCMCVCE